MYKNNNNNNNNNNNAEKLLANWRLLQKLSEDADKDCYTMLTINKMKF